MKKMYSMQALATALCLIFCATFINAQESHDHQEINGTGKRILITAPTPDQLKAIQIAGMDLHCGAKFEGENLRLDVNASDVKKLRELGLDIKVQIEDLTTFFAERAARTRDKAIADLEKMQAETRKNREKTRASSSTGDTSIESFIQREACDEIDWVSTNFRLGGFNDPAVTFGSCLTVDEVLIELDRMRSLYPNLISLKLDASPTGQQTNGNTTGPATADFDPQTVYYVRISDDPDNDNTIAEGMPGYEPETLITGMTHAREVNSMMNVIYYMWWILENYDTEPAVKNMIDNQELYFIPVVNPDGVKWNEKIAPSGGGLQRKNLRPNTNDNGTTNSSNNRRGVDLNRNAEYYWGFDNVGSNGSSLQDTYRGPSPASEPESQILADFVQSRNFKYAINHHSGINSIVTSSYNGNPNANPSNREDEYQKLMHDITRFNRYIHGSAPNTLTNANGDTNDYMLGGEEITYTAVNGVTYTTSGSGKNIITFSPENGDDFWPASGDITIIAQRAVRMNLLTSLYAGAYARLHDQTPSSITTLNPTLDLAVEYLGQTSNDLTLTVNGVTNVAGVTQIGATALDGMSILEQRTVSPSLTLDPAIAAGDLIEYEVTLSNETYVIYQTTVRKYYTPGVIIDADGIGNWSGTWSATTDGYNGSTNAVTSTPSPPYGNNEQRFATLTTDLDLTTSNSTVIQFNAKWDLERNFDFVQFEGSIDNGATWTALCGKYTKVASGGPGNLHLNKDANDEAHQGDFGELIYDGDLTYDPNIVNTATATDDVDKWVMEEFLIDPFNNSTFYNQPDVRFRFYFDTDSSNREDGYDTNFEGFTFDNFKVIAIDQEFECTDNVIDTFPYEESFDNSLGLWTKAAGDAGNWWFEENETVSSGTGPLLPNEGSHYIFMEASTNGANPPGVGRNSTGQITSSCIDLTGQVEADLTFDLHMFGASMGSLDVQVSTDAGASWTSLAPGIDPLYVGNQQATQASAWNNETVNLDAYAGQVIKLRFEGKTTDTSNHWSGDIAIDNLAITTVEAASCTTTTTFSGGTWDNGAPTTNVNAVIASDYDMVANTLPNIEACSLTINNGATLTIAGGQYASITNDITVNGNLVIEHEGSVVQTAPEAITTTNPTGNIDVKKTTTMMHPRDFSYMGSPVSDESREGVYSASRKVIELVPLNFSPDPVVDTQFPNSENFLSVDNTFLNQLNTDVSLVPGLGYFVFPSPNFAAPEQTYNFTYNANGTDGTTLNSGDIIVPIDNSRTKVENFNLLSNPYPSGIDLEALILGNDNISEVYLWEHNTVPNPTINGYLNGNFSMEDFTVCNAIGCAAGGNIGDISGPTTATTISSGQGFAIKAEPSPAASSVTFTNSMRTTVNNTFRANETDEDRLWLKITNDQYDLYSQTLIAFDEQGTPGIDKGFDSKRMATALNIFSTPKEDAYLSIQARELFKSDMQLAVGYSTVVEEKLTYTISIDAITGNNLEQHPVYLYDVLLDRYVNLKERSYTFISTEVTAPNRFIIAFEQPEVLGTESIDTLQNEIGIYPNPANNLVTLSYYGDQVLSTAQVIDVNGKVIKQIDLTDFNNKKTVDVSNIASGIYFVNVESQTNTTVKKLIIR